MSKRSVSNQIDKRIKRFVIWIAPKGGTQQLIKKQAAKIRGQLKKQAEGSKIIIKTTSYAGSFYTKTGLRGHFKGQSDVEGQDVDLPFVIDQRSITDKSIHGLLDKFYSFTRKSFSDKSMKKTKSSIKLQYSDTFSYDIVPMLATNDNEKQIIIRSDGERIETSVQQHIKFIKERTQKSKALAGFVEFNECVRLIKWWREVQIQQSKSFRGNQVPFSFLLNLLCAKAFDKLSVAPTYVETLDNWFGFLAQTTRNREMVYFSKSRPKLSSNSEWMVLDPVNPKNNITKKWTSSDTNYLAKQFDQAKKILQDIQHHQETGQESKCLELFTQLFGRSFRHYSQ